MEVQDLIAPSTLPEAGLTAQGLVGVSLHAIAEAMFWRSQNVAPPSSGSPEQPVAPILPPHIVRGARLS